MTLAAVLLLAASAARPFAEERLLLDRRLETLRRILPDGPAPATDVAVVQELARTAVLSIDATARAPLEKGGRGAVAIDVGASGRFLDIERFFRQVALSHRLIDVETLTLAAASGDQVKLTALLQLPYRPLTAPLPQVPEGLRARLSDVPRPQADAFLRDQALALAKSETVAHLRRNRRNPRLFFAELASVVRDRPVVLKEATVADDFAIRGLIVGEGSMRSLERRLERGFFRIHEVLVARQGACHRFEVRGRCPVAGVEAELPMPAVDDPFHPDEGPCAMDRDGGGLQVLLSPSKAPKMPARSGRAESRPLAAARPETVTLRLRDLDVVDVVHVLHLLTGQAFVVDEDVRGRVVVDAADLTVDEVLALLSRAGVAVSPPGPLRRISREAATAVSPSPAGVEEGARVTFALKRAAVRDVLNVVAEADASLGVSPGPGALGRVSVFARDVPARDVLAAVVAAARLEEREEQGRRVVVRRGGGGSDEPVSKRALAVRADELVVSEFRLAGVASAGNGWTAVAYAPNGILLSYRRGDRLADAAVTDVESTDVLLETEEGPLRIALIDPGR